MRRDTAERRQDRRVLLLAGTIAVGIHRPRNRKKSAASHARGTHERDHEADARDSVASLISDDQIGGSAARTRIDSDSRAVGVPQRRQVPKNSEGSVLEYLGELLISSSGVLVALDVNIACSQVCSQSFAAAESRDACACCRGNDIRQRDVNQGHHYAISAEDAQWCSSSLSFHERPTGGAGRVTQTAGTDGEVWLAGSAYQSHCECNKGAGNNSYCRRREIEDCRYRRSYSPRQSNGGRAASNGRSI